VFAVKDNGCGIASGRIEEIFEPFFTTKEIDRGCGLGLTIVSEIVKNYEGLINVESEINKGTSISITIPVRRADERQGT
jgi:signal transduction histidine kinase